MKRSELGSPKTITPVGILLYKGWRNGSRNTNNCITIRSCGISYKIKIRKAVHKFNSKQEKLKLKKILNLLEFESSKMPLQVEK